MDDADGAIFEILLSTRARGSCCCGDHADDVAIFSILLQVLIEHCAMFQREIKFRAFFRGFKTVGPFVVMIYRMVVGDLLRFVCIYMVFVMGFSQAYYIIFLTFDNSEEEDPEPELNPISSPMESFISMFLMSLGNFGDYYGGMEFTEHETHAKVGVEFNLIAQCLRCSSSLDSLRRVHGDCCRPTYQHVDCHDG